MNTIPRLTFTLATAVALLIGSSRSTDAQTFGVVAGMNVSTLADLQSPTLNSAFSAAAGYHIGVFTEIGPVRPSLLYLNAGSMFDGAAFLGTGSFSTSYLAIPIDVKLSVIPALYLFAGPELQLKVSSGAPSDFNDDIKSLVAHGGLGMGVQASRLHLEGRFLFGLSSLTRDTYQVGAFTVTGGKQMSNAVRFSAGVSF